MEKWKSGIGEIEIMNKVFLCEPLCLLRGPLCNSGFIFGRMEKWKVARIVVQNRA